jgi:uncharacterized membrane protein
MLLFGLPFAIFWMFSAGKNSMKHGVGPTYGYVPPSANVDVTSLRIAVSWEQRAFVQKELERIARTCDTSTPDGLAHMLRETTMVLRRGWSGWLSASIYSQRPSTAQHGEAMFRQIAADAKFRFEQEIIRNQRGVVSESDTPQLHARSDEGPGVVVITLVVAARTELVDFPSTTQYDHVRLWLEAMSQFTGHGLMAVDIVWSPAAEDDRLSSAELAVLYPELHRINPTALMGRVACTHCAAPYPAELVTCPHCGARAAA